jgi:hypothetical protein
MAQGFQFAARFYAPLRPLIESTYKMPVSYACNKADKRAA